MTERAYAHVARFNEAVRGGDWRTFTATFTDDATMVFTNVPAGPFAGREAILAGYEAQPPDDTMTITSVEPVDPDTDRVRFSWDAGSAELAGLASANPAPAGAGGSGTMLLRWRDTRLAGLEITFGTS